jgi:proline iminopeptidase
VIDDRPTYPLEHLLRLPDGQLAEWEAIGDGPPLLWIEGGPGLPAHLARPDLELFASDFRGHLVNAPGCGRSSPPPPGANYGLETIADWFEAIREALELGRVTVMGHSWGGLVALRLALAYPESVDRLVLIDSYAGEASVPEAVAGAERERALDRVRKEPWFEEAIASFGHDFETARELDDRFRSCWPLYFASPDTPASRAHIERLGRETRWNVDAVRAWDPEPAIDLRPDLARITCPTLVVVGEHDFICGPAWARAIAGSIPAARYVELSSVGHLPQYEAPEQLRTAVIDFVRASLTA